MKGALAFAMFMLAAASVALVIWQPATKQPPVRIESSLTQASAGDPVISVPGVIKNKVPSAPAKPSEPVPEPDHLAKYVKLITYYQPNLGEITARKYAATIVSSSLKSGIDPLWIVAMIRLESNFDNRATSIESAIGLMQIMPATGRAIGYSPYSLRNPETNIMAGVSYLATLRTSFGGDIAKAITAYNQGSSRVRKGTARMQYYNDVHHTYKHMKYWIQNHG